jgi:hypothetical protein
MTAAGAAAAHELAFPRRIRRSFEMRYRSVTAAAALH